METVEKNVPFTRMEDVENAVWKRLKENDDYRTIQKRFDDMLEAIGRADADKAFVYDLEEAIGLRNTMRSGRIIAKAFWMAWRC